jgi:uncharacterized OB-fold protein
MSTDTRFDGPGPDEIFAAAITAGHFKIQRCRICAAVRFPPALVCNCCGSSDLKWIEANGEGEVYATTVVHEREGPYNVALITLQEGARMMSRVEGVAANEVRIGMKVRARIAKEPQPHIIFDVVVVGAL